MNDKTDEGQESIATMLQRLRADKSGTGFYVIPSPGLKIEASVWQGGVNVVAKFRPDYAEGNADAAAGQDTAELEEAAVSLLRLVFD